MAKLAILQPDARTQARLVDALSSTHSVSVVRGWAELRRFVAEANADGCLVDADSPTREGALMHMRRLRREHPELAMVAYADVRASDPELVRLGAAGVDGVVAAGRPPWASGIRRCVEASLAAAVARSVERAMGPGHPAAAAAVGWAVEHAAEGPSVARLAASVGRTPRGLAALLREAGLPSPTRILLWGRLLQAGAFLGRDGATVEAAALSLGYSTATALSRAMKREAGYTAGEIARAGGLPLVRARLFPRRAARTPHDPPAGPRS